MAIIDIKRTVSLDGAIMPVALEGTLYSGENQAHRFIINATKDGAALNLTGSVTASFLRKADDAEVPLTGEIIGGGAAVTLVQSCYTQPGRFELTIFITQNGSKNALYSCNGNVRNTSASEIVDPGHVVPDISDIVAEYARMQAASDAAEAAATNANEAAQFATDDEWTNGDTLQTGRVYQTLHMANFEEETAGQYLRVISGNVAQAERVNQSGWSVYRYDLPHRMLIRLEAIEKNTPTVQGVLPMAAVLTSGSTETLYSLDSDRTGTYILADALLCNYNTTLNASAIKSVSITAVANRQFEDVIVCLDHAAAFDKIVVFGDSIFANYINSTTVGNGVMAQFASLMGLPVVNNAVGGATLSTIQTSPKSVVQQVQDYVGSATPGGTPLYMIDGGTNDQYNNGAGLANLGQYTDGVNGITNTIYGATYRIINDLLGFGAQPWQIVVTTPIPKDIRNSTAEHVAEIDAQLTAIGAAMYDIGAAMMVNVINGYGGVFDNLTDANAMQLLMPDNTHPSQYGAKLYAERIFRLLGVASQQEVTSLKSAIKNITGNEQIQYSDPSKRQYIATNGATVQWDTPSTSASTQIKWAVVPCVPGDVFTINGRGGGSDRLWAFADASKNILDPRAGSGASATNLVLTAPTNAAYLILNSEIPTAESYTGELLLDRLDGFVENDNLLYDFALQGNGSTIVSENFKLLSGNTYKLAVLNAGSWSGSSSSMRLQLTTHPSGGDHNIIVAFTPNDEYIFTADADDATIMVRADAGSTVQIKLYDITEITNYISGLDRAAFANDFAVESGTTYCTVSWSRLYVQTNGKYYDFDTSASYTLNGTNPILAIRNSLVTLVGSFVAIRSTDIILLVYNNGAIIGGLLYPYYANAGTGTGSGIGVLPNAVFCNNFTAESIVGGVKIGWTRLYIKLKDGEFNTTTAASYEINNSSPILIVRNGSVMRIGTFGGLRETDIVLLVCYAGTVTGGLLYPYYKNSIEQFKYVDDAHLNVYRNTQQLANLKWTPKSAVDSGEGEHPAGVEVTGVPYSSVKEYLKYVGIDVSIHTFMTAVNDVHSLLYTEYPMGSGSQSAYGRTYHGVNCKTFFGTVCSGFVTTGLGDKIQYNSWEFQTFPDKFDVLMNQDVKNLCVGDIMSYDGHTGIITNIRRNAAGSIATLQLDEQSAPIHIGAGHTPNTLTARAIASKGVWCRYKNLENNTKYTPSAFVLAPGEYLYNGGDFCFIDGVSSRTYYQCKPSNPNSDATFTASKWNTISQYTPGTTYTSVPASYMSINEKLYQCIDGHTAGSTPDMTKWKEIHGVFEWAAYPYVYNDDIVTFAGDRAAFHSNDLIYINYAKGNYTAMQIYKDGTLIQTITLPASGYQVDVSSYCADAGMYKARLTDGTNYSRYTYFEVIETDVNATWANGEVTIDFASANSTPIEWQIVEQSGATVCHNSFSVEEIKSGQVIVNPKAKMYAEKHIYPRRVNGYSATIYARVMFAGEYGNVVNAMIELGTLSDVNGELVFPNNPKDIGTISETTNVLLAGRMHGSQYSFTFGGGGATVNVLPAIGTIKWVNTIPASPTNGTTYLVTVNNGIGDVVSVS